MDALPVLHRAYARDQLPGAKSQTHLEADALAAVIAVLLPIVRPLILAERGFARATCRPWRQRPHRDDVIRLDKGTGVTEADGHRWKLGEDGRTLGQAPWVPHVRYGRSHGRPRELHITLALCWQVNARRTHHPRHVAPAEPWYLATSLGTVKPAVAWYWQRGWIEQRFKDSKRRLGLNRGQVQCAQRLTRLLMALTLALTWVSFLGLPELKSQPRGWHAAGAQRGRASIISLALARLDDLGDLPAGCLPPSTAGGYT